MFNEFPNLHPLVVHFPIVLILLSVVLQAVLLFKDYSQIKWGTLFIMGAAFVGAVLASYVFHAHTGQLNTSAASIYERHENYAFYTVWLSGLTFLLQGIGLFYKLHQRSFAALVFVPALLSAVFVSIAGHQGAKLVYVEGVGPQGKHLMEGHSHTEGMEDNHEGMDMHSGDTAHDTGNMDHHGNMKMDSGSTMPGMDHSKMNMPNSGSNMDGVDHSKMNVPNRNGNMTGMDHSNMNMSRSNGNMQGMDHSKMNMPRGSNNMKGIDHSKMNMPAGNKNMEGMDHSKMNMPKSSTQNKSMEGMDHSKMDLGTGNNNNMPGMNHGNMDMKSGSTGMQGMDHGNMPQGPLIDPSKPYDNNPAQEEKRVKQN